MAYAARCAGQAPGWAPLPVQYVDYTLWQRAQLGDLDDTDSRIAEQLGYWEEALAGLPERLELPTDRPYPPVADYRGARVAVDWPAELQQRVARMAREHNATSFMVVQAALAVLLAKLSASTDVAVGFPIAGRRDPALDELVGFLRQHPGVAGRCGRGSQVRRAAGAGAAAQPGRLRASRCAVRGVGGAAQPDPLADASPVGAGDVGLAELRRRPCAAALSLGDVQVTPLPVDTRTARMDLTFSLGERWTEAGEPAGIGGEVEFRTDVFDAASIEMLIERLQRVLVAMTADPTRRLSSVDVLDEVEHARLDEVGNRAVLTQPAADGCGGVDSGVVRCAGGTGPGGGGADLRRPLDDVSGAR